MTIGELTYTLEQHIPTALAWSNDNVGLQVGNPATSIKNILLTLDVTIDVVSEAIQKKANLIIAHHPLLFQPLRSLTPHTRVGKIAYELVQNNIGLYAAHTNLDSVKWGVSGSLAEKLGLTDVRILSPLKDTLTKIVVFVPESHVEKIAQAMHDAGGGMFTKYQECSFRTEGIGTFKGMNNANPYIGKIGELEKAPEIKLEMLVEHWKISSVLKAMKETHPYEEIAYDIYPLKNSNTEYGLGVIGTFSQKMKAKDFFSFLKKKLHLQHFRYTGDVNTYVKKIALCGGSGSEFVKDAIQQQADVYITGDVKYHTFQEAEEKILLIDVGHFETEHHILPTLAEKISQMVKSKKNTSKIFITRKTINPVHYY